MEGGTSFHFVTDGIEPALQQAFVAAKGICIEEVPTPPPLVDRLVSLRLKRSSAFESMQVAPAPVSTITRASAPESTATTVMWHCLEA